MAAHSRTTFQKRQKELARMEKQRDKAARRAQRKLERTSLSDNPDAIEDLQTAETEEPEAEPQEAQPQEARTE